MADAPLPTTAAASRAAKLKVLQFSSWTRTDAPVVRFMTRKELLDDWYTPQWRTTRSFKHPITKVHTEVPAGTKLRAMPPAVSF